MTHLGSLGKPRDNDAITFDYFGTEITAHTVTDLEYLDFMEQIGSLTPDNPESQRLVKQFARLCFGDETFEQFWTLARANKQSQEDVFEVLMQVVEASTGRPTESPSGSSDGQSPTATRSTDDSSSLADRLKGRPDLQLVGLQAQEARAS